MKANINDLPFEENGNGKDIGNRRKRLSRPAGGSMIGCSYYEVEPGKSTWPLHAHLGNEEAIFILEGSGTVRIGNEVHTAVKGDYIYLPMGEDRAHQLTNTSHETLKYLCISTMLVPDVVLYPKSGKVGIFNTHEPMNSNHEGYIKFFSTAEALGYYHGED
jgi:uncharacterized cupin superfamily protein